MPLKNVSTNSGRDLEVKIEWDNMSFYTDEGVLTQEFSKPVYARYIKLYIEDWVDYPSIHWDFFIDGVLEITDKSNRTHSSVNGGQNENAHNDGATDSLQWSPEHRSGHTDFHGDTPWSIVDLGSVKRVTGIKTLNRQSPSAYTQQRVTKFRLEHSLDNDLYHLIPNTSQRFYKGWNLELALDYTRTTFGTTNNPEELVSAKFSEDKTWYNYNQRIAEEGNNAFVWNFSQFYNGHGSSDDITKTQFENTQMTDTIGYNNVGFNTWKWSQWRSK